MSEDRAPSPEPGAAALALMGRVYRLVLDAHRLGTIEELAFLVANRTIEVVPHARAALWRLAGAPYLLAVSGAPDVDRASAAAVAWRAAVSGLGPPDREHPAVDALRIAAAGEAWTTTVGPSGASVVWVPLAAGEAGLWLERAADQPWRDGELAIVRALVDGYETAWQRHAPARRLATRSRARRVALAALALGVIALATLPRAPLRVAAPCEVVPRDPYLVTAPLAGVIAALDVEPGQRVAAGATLFRYDDRAALEALEVARRAVEISRAQVERATVEALEGVAASERTLRALEGTLAQDEARLALATRTAERLVVLAPAAGVVQVDQPHQWRGRPVQLGERVLLLVEPDRVMLRVWVAAADRLDGLADHDVAAYLDAAPETPPPARIERLALAVEVPPVGGAAGGVPSFVAEAAFTGPPPAGTLGLRGTAFLYGEPGSFAYGLVRKPWSALRARLGW